MYKILEEANLNSSDEIAELQSNVARLSSNFDITNSIKLSLDNLNYYKDGLPSVSALITQSIKQLNKVVQFDSKIKDLNENLINIQSDLENLIFALTEYSEELENEDISCLLYTSPSPRDS